MVDRPFGDSTETLFEPERTPDFGMEKQSELLSELVPSTVSRACCYIRIAIEVSEFLRNEAGLCVSELPFRRRALHHFDLVPVYHHRQLRAGLEKRGLRKGLRTRTTSEPVGNQLR